MGSERNSGGLGMFFTGNERDYRGDLYAKTCLEAPYNAPSESVQTRTIMLAGNYLPETNPRGIMDNDVHPEFTDFIIECALWHRELDKPIEIPGSIYHTMRKHTDELTSFLLAEYPATMSPPSLNGAQVDPQYYMINSNSFIGAAFITSTFSTAPVIAYLAGISKTHPTAIKINMDSMMIDFFLRLWTKLQATPSNNLDDRKNMIKNNTSEPLYITSKVDWLVDYLINGNNGITTIVGAAIANTGIITSHLMGDTTPMCYTDLMKASGKVTTLMIDSIIADAKVAINDYIINGIIPVVNGIYNSQPVIDRNLLGTLATAFNIQVTQAGQPLSGAQFGTFAQKLTALKNAFNCDVHINELIRIVQGVVLTALKRFIPEQRTKLTDQYPMKFYNYVTKNANRERDNILNKFLMILEGNNGLAYNARPRNMNDARLNFREENHRLDAVSRFNTTIPNLTAQNVWYTRFSSTGGTQVVKLEMKNGVDFKNFFRNLYRIVYTNNATSNVLRVDLTETMVRLQVPSSYDRILPQKKYPLIFHLLDSSTILGRMMREVEQMNRSQYVNEENDNAMLTCDVDTGVEYLYEDGILYRKIGDTKQNMDPLNADGSPNPYWNESTRADNNCASTFATGSAYDCTRFVDECLANTTQGIEECFNNGSISQDFLTLSIGVNEMSKLYNEMNPHMAKRILNQFGFKPVELVDDSNNMYYSIESYETWLARSLEMYKTNEDIKRLIQCASFRTYVSALCNFLTCNRALLNKDYRGTAKITPYRSVFAMMADIQPAPVVSANRLNVPYALSPSILGSSMLPPGFTNGVYTSSPLTNSVMPFMRGGRRGRNQRGGVIPTYASVNPNVSSTSDIGRYANSERHGAKLLRRIYNNVVQELGIRNKTLGESSKKKIEERISELERKEKAVVENLVQLDKYATLSTIFNDRNVNKTVNTNDINKMVNDHAELVKYFTRDQLKLNGILSKLIRIANNDPVMEAYASSIGQGSIPNRSLYKVAPVIPSASNRSLADL
jgi:hypothetical protein